MFYLVSSLPTLLTSLSLYFTFHFAVTYTYKHIHIHKHTYTYTGDYGNTFLSRNNNFQNEPSVACNAITKALLWAIESVRKMETNLGSSSSSNSNRNSTSIRNSNRYSNGNSKSSKHGNSNINSNSNSNINSNINSNSTLDLKDIFWIPFGRQFIGILINHISSMKITEEGSKTLLIDIDQYVNCIKLFNIDNNSTSNSTSTSAKDIIDMM